MTGFVYDLPHHTKVLVREEVQLYTLINFFGEVGGYLGLLLGESLISYLIITSNWVQILGRKLKARCRKAEKEPESPPANGVSNTAKPEQRLRQQVPVKPAQAPTVKSLLR